VVIGLCEPVKLTFNLKMARPVAFVVDNYYTKYELSVSFCS